MQTSQSSEPSAKKAVAKPRARKSAGKTETLHLKTASPAAVQDLTPMIATAAYFYAERRGFAPGHELEDWLAAEHQVRTTYSS